MPVVDASVAVKWLIDEEGSTKAHELRRRSLHAPSLLVVEVGNVVRTVTTRGELSITEAKRAPGLLMEMPVTWHEPYALMDDALAHALRLNHPIYDCVYLALALRLGVPMVTADKRFLRAVQAEPDFAETVRAL